MRFESFSALGGRRALAGVCLALALAALAGPAAGGDDGAPALGMTTDGGPIDDATLERLLELHHVEEQTIRVVLLPTSVQDKRGRVVRGLTRKDFRLFDEGESQDIRYFTSGLEETLAIAFLLDVSGSMRQLGKIEEAKEAIRFLVSTLRDDDRMALICFADEQVAWVTDFTSDRGRFLERLAVQEAYGQTALNDAVAAAPGLVDEGTVGRKAIVLITDGVDNASELSAGEAARLARKVAVPIYTLGFTHVPAKLRRSGEAGKVSSILGYMSRETGGRLFSVHDPDELKEAVSRIDDELRHQYLIGYHPVVSDWDGAFRRITLELPKRRLEARTRKGYYAIP